MADLKPVNHINSPHMTYSMTLRELQETMLATEGWILREGKMWDIKSKRLAPGVYRVWCEVRNG